MPSKLTESEIAAKLPAFTGWSALGDRSIRRTCTFKDHITAMGFVVRVAMAAEVLDHHPDLRIVYNRVEIVLNTHDADGVTEKDFALAGRIDALV